MLPSIRRCGRALAAAALALLAGFAAGPARAQDAPPNIIMLMTDDLDISVWRSALEQGLLPHIRAELVDKGTTFTNTFAALPTCCPSRATYLTGQYPHNHGVSRNSGKRGGFASFAGDASTLATWMRAAGYRTGLIGKYLNLYGFTAGDQGGAYVPPGWDTWKALFTSAEFNYSFSNQGVLEQRGSTEADYQTDVLREFALQFVREPDARPFFLTLTPTAPHYESAAGDDDGGSAIRPAPRHTDTPVLATIPPEALASFNEADLADKPAYMRSAPLVDPAALRRGYNSKIAAMRAVDDMLGALVGELRARGADANTVIVFTSDNGFQYGTHRRTGKADLYEESARIPMVIRAAGQTAPSTVEAWVMNTDWAPTIAELGRASPGRVVDGRSLVPWLAGGAGGSARRTILVEHPVDGVKSTQYPSYAAVRSKDPALTGDASGALTLAFARIYSPLGKVTDVEFYDLSIDPMQTQSLHASTDGTRRAQMKALAARLEALRSCSGATCQTLEN